MSGNVTQWLDVLAQSRGSLSNQRDWQPAADVYRVGDGWLIKLDLAGVSPDEVRITAAGRQLTVSGVRRDHIVEHGCAHYRMEISYSRFQRTLELPCRLDESSISAEARDGMFLIRVHEQRSP